MIFISQLTKEIHPTRYDSALQWPFLTFPWNSEVKEPWPENYPHYLSGLSSVLLRFFSDNLFETARTVLLHFIKHETRIDKK